MLQEARQRRATLANPHELDANAVTQAAVRRHDARHDRAGGQRDALAHHPQRDIDLRASDHGNGRTQEQATDADVDRRAEDRELLTFEPAFAAQRVTLVASSLGSSRWLLDRELWDHAGGTFVEPEARRPIRRMQAHVA